MRLRWTNGARTELLDFVAYISPKRPVAARSLAKRIQSTMLATLEFPYIGRVVPELEIANIRERLVSPYRIVYQVRRAEIVVLAVVHARRDFPEPLGSSEEG